MAKRLQQHVLYPALRRSAQAIRLSVLQGAGMTGLVANKHLLFGVGHPPIINSSANPSGLLFAGQRLLRLRNVLNLMERHGLF